MKYLSVINPVIMDKLYSIYNTVIQVKERDYLCFLSMNYFYNQFSCLVKMLPRFSPTEKEIIELYIENGISIISSTLTDQDMTLQLQVNRDLHNEKLKHLGTSLSIRPTFISENGEEIPYGN